MTVSANAVKIQKSFTKQAKKFETPKMNFTKQEYLNYMISKISPQKQDTVLEVAAGTCVCGRNIAPLVGSVTCMDMTTAMLAVGQNEAVKQGLCNMTFVRGDAEKLPFLDNGFDIVISRLAFHHFSDPQRCFSEMARVLKTNGKLMIVDMEATDESLRNTEDEIELLRDPSHIRNLNRNEFADMFAENHLTITDTDCTEIPVSLTSWLALTNTPAEISKELFERFSDEIDGGVPTGFKPYQKDSEIYFNQRWLMVIGHKRGW